MIDSFKKRLRPEFRYSLERLGKKVLLLLILMAVSLIGFFVVDEIWLDNKHFDFKIDSNYKATLITNSCSNCDQHYEVDFKLEISKLDNTDRKTYSFTTQKGPQIAIFTTGQNSLVVCGFGFNQKECNTFTVAGAARQNQTGVPADTLKIAHLNLDYTFNTN